MKPNIVLMMVDQMRGDCLGVNGNEFIETPNLDMMATEGYNFENAYTAVPSCIASRTSILTGMSQKSHGRVGYEGVGQAKAVIFFLAVIVISMLQLRLTRSKEVQQ